MWNLLAAPVDTPKLKPSASSGTVTNPTYAYDVDAYPWSTFAQAYASGSAVAGTYDDSIVVYSTFPTIAKTAFTSLDLAVVIDYTITPNFSTGASGFIISSAFKYEYSTDGGSTWTTRFSIGSTYLQGGIPYGVSYPAQDISVVGLTDASPSSMTKLQINTTIASSSFSTGVQDLRVRFVASTLKSTRTANPASTVTYKVWDISAVVS